MSSFSKNFTFWYNLKDPYGMLKHHLPYYNEQNSNNIIKNILYCSPIITFSYLTIEDYNYLIEYFFSEYCSFDISDIISFLNNQMLTKTLKNFQITEENKIKYWILLNASDWDFNKVLEIAKRYKINWRLLEPPNRLLAHLLIVLKDDLFFSMNIRDFENNDGDFPLHTCVKLKLYDFVKYLVNQDKTRCLVQNKDGFFPIDLCISNKDNEMFFFLLPFCKKLEKRDNDLIHLVCMYGTKKMLKGMLKMGYRMTRNVNGVDCYKLAVLNNNNEVYTWIKKKKNRKCFCL